MRDMTQILVTAVAMCFISNAIAACLPGWTKSPSDTCWKFFASPETYNSARASCRAIGAELVTLPTKTDVIFLRGFRSYFGKESVATWIGADKYFRYWRWDGIHTGRIAFSDWNPNEPSNTGGHEDCIEAHYSGGKGWRDQECSDRNAYICEMRQR